MSASDAALSRAQALTAELFSADNGRALAWSTLAGLATFLGGLLAVIKRPEAGLLAFLLGTAIGVMATLSVLELFIQNAVDNGAVPVALCAAAGGASGPGRSGCHPRRHSSPIVGFCVQRMGDWSMSPETQMLQPTHSRMSCVAPARIFAGRDGWSSISLPLPYPARYPLPSQGGMGRR